MKGECGSFFICFKSTTTIASHFYIHNTKDIITTQSKEGNLLWQMGGISFIVRTIGQTLKPPNVLWRISQLFTTELKFDY
jgi:hypothetical protein